MILEFSDDSADFIATDTILVTDIQADLHTIFVQTLKFDKTVINPLTPERFESTITSVFF